MKLPQRIWLPALVLLLLGLALTLPRLGSSGLWDPWEPKYAPAGRPGWSVRQTARSTPKTRARPDVFAAWFAPTTSTLPLSATLIPKFAPGGRAGAPPAWPVVRAAGSR